MSERELIEIMRGLLREYRRDHSACFVTANEVNACQNCIQTEEILALTAPKETVA